MIEKYHRPSWRRIDRMTRGEQSFLQDIRTIFECGTFDELTDRQLLERIAGRDRATAERGFAALVQRHGAMVFRTCQAILRDRHDAEDAFQATFLALARKARSLWVRDSLGPWLFQVSCRVASHQRSAALRRRLHERAAARTAAGTTDDEPWEDRGAAVWAELQRLPDRYRAAVVLCDLEGLTQERAAQVLGWPAGTVRSRLARGRKRLRDRLARRGLAPCALPHPSPLSGDAPKTAVPATLAEITTQTAVRLVADRVLTGTTASVATLTEGVLRAMFWKNFKVVAAAILAGGLCAGTALLAYWSAGRQEGQPGAAQSAVAAKAAPGAIATPIAPASGGARSLTASAKARLNVANELRSRIFYRYQIDPAIASGFIEVLTWQNRYDELIRELLVKTDADRVRFLEHRVATLKRIEDSAREMFKGSQASYTDVLAAEHFRREAEDLLEKARAKLAASGAAPTETASSELVQFLNLDSWPPPEFPPPRITPAPNSKARP